jgi:hypothetical protein
MSSMYCDRCGQVDQTISLDALQALDSGPQFSQGVGGVIRDGEYTPFMATSMQGIDTELADLQSKSYKFASLEGLLEERGITKSKSEVVRSANFWQIMAPMGVGLIVFFVALGVRPFSTFNENSIFSLFMIVVSAIGFVWTIRLVNKNAKVKSQEIQAKVTPEMRALVARRSRGSYCRRCNTFSPAHD